MGFLGSIFAAKNQFQAEELPGSGQFIQQDFAGALEQARNPQIQKDVLPTEQADQTRAQQQQFAQGLQGQAAGTAPSVAGAQLNQAVGAQNAQAASALGSQRGINPALAARLIAQQQAQNTQGMAGAAATAGIQERNAAQSLLGNALAQQRGQDIGQAQSQVQAGLGLGQLGNQQMGITQGAIANQNQQLVGQNLGVQQINSGVAQANTNAANAWGGKIFDAASAAAGLASKAEGGVIEGTAAVAGDSYENDTVPIMASPGEVVLPRSVASDPERAKEFVESLRQGAAPGSSKAEKEPSYAEVVESHRKLEERLKALEHMAYGGRVC